MDTLILQDRQPQVGARSWKQQSGGRKGEWDFIFPADKLCNRQTMVSRPEESNLTGISSKMTAMQVDQDVTPWISRDTQSKVVWDCWQQHGCMPNAEHTLTHMQICPCLHMKPDANVTHIFILHWSLLMGNHKIYSNDIPLLLYYADHYSCGCCNYFIDYSSFGSPLVVMAMAIITSPEVYLKNIR